MSLYRDIKGAIVQGFATKRIESITAGSEWTPEDDDIAFRVAGDCSYYINNDNSVSADLNGGAVTVIVKGYTYTFDTTQKIEVM